MKESFTFNESACSINDVNPGCKELWTIGQQEAIRRLSVKTRNEFKQTACYELVENFSARAERIAANYAKIYLELEHNGKPELKGRFYWTGLAAFASKQVMCALDYATDSKWRYTVAPIYFFNETKTHLGKGNFWLFQDIFVWHWFYINHPEQFAQCIGDRHWNKYTESFLLQFKTLPWLDDVLPKIDYLQKNPHLELGFKWISVIEEMREGKAREDKQLESLMAIAKHEQLKVLQPLIYDSWVFQKLLDMQALVEGNLGVPRRLAAMSIACETNDPDYDTIMTKGKLYNDNDRMNFIKEIANNYHRLMRSKRAYMEENISHISSWSDNV
ncbi:DUF2515 family protein [Pseudomonas sp.]|uniref:DUF2515 family protein n=1 Tax=Pseudomonas sp. TaxID=306 RepID=UPI0028AF6172|nr:hypothetical protein [Pseudomonas sp.]